MVDFQYQPDMLDPIAQLRISMDNLDGSLRLLPWYRSPHLIFAMSAQAVKDFRFGPEKEDYSVLDQVVDPSLMQDGEDIVMQEPKYRSNLRLFPPPIFSRQGIPHVYK
jgi:general transcription factor 3C polypeptide 5 (transcription factor C subunit 1)